jgi:hypothetical protein
MFRNTYAADFGLLGEIKVLLLDRRNERFSCTR